ncbi:hypothetical protein LX32DRAFT_606149 [Colletotrichum zoysiae]|uniref:Tat pathway signal sequence n=1 Tax=Colletotrichum zoysiae TaxID=1216348 RepID=A0AAD9H2C1_9PEZI|nr:hypothetical protein LX32DRAFT_606149 [Colletotrichum zoysiae]
MVFEKGYSFSKLDSEIEIPLEAEEPSILPKSRIASFQFNLAELACRSICFLTFVAGGVMIVSALRWAPSDQYCAAQLGVWSPLLDVIEYEEWNWETDSEMANSGFTGPPTPELEAKWINISQVPAVIIPPERLSSLNRNPDPFVPVSSGSPSSGYIAGVEVFHHLHCLNALRQIVWRDSYSEGKVPVPNLLRTREGARRHAEHCVETLRQALMCTSDVTPYLIYKTEDTSPGAPPAREDFQASHRCRRFPKLLEWITDNGVPLSSLEILNKET